MSSSRSAPKAVTDWLAQVVEEVFEDKKVQVTDPKNLDVQSMCPTFPEEIPVFIEISKGSHNKYEWDVQHNIMILDRVLSSAVFYPYDYGFVPQTLCEDGDPLDVLVIGSNPVLPGVVCKARPLGYLDFLDVDKVDGKEVHVGDQKLLAVLTGDRTYNSWKDLSDVPESILEMISEFFQNYKNLEKKTVMKPSIERGWKDAAAAKKLTLETHTVFTDKVEKALAEKRG